MSNGCAMNPLATLPSKQGLKRKSRPQVRELYAPLATLPSKQGLKHIHSTRP